jgi:hypothetical protein
MLCGGCTRRRALNTFVIKPGMKQKDFEDLYGSPTKEIPSWMAYPLDDGNELRIFFLIGPKVNGGRSVGQAGVYNPAGYRIKLVFNLLPDDTLPATQPTSQAAEIPATQPLTS